MGLLKLSQGEVLHRQGDGVKTLDLLLSGSISAQAGSQRVTYGPGALIGITEEAGAEYALSYEAEADAQLYTYDYYGESDLVNLIHQNAKLAPAIATEAVRSTVSLYSAYQQLFSEFMAEYQAIQNDRGEYPMLAAATHRTLQVYSELEKIQEPEDVVFQEGWECDYLTAMEENAPGVRNGFYSLSVDLTIGTILMIKRLQDEAFQGVIRMLLGMEKMKEISESICMEMSVIRTKEKAMTQASESGDSDDTPIVGAFDKITSWAQVPADKIMTYHKLMMDFKALPDRTDTSDVCRKLRRLVTDMFYDIYMAAFLKAMDDPMNIPLEVRMFLVFGFLDEELAGENYTAILKRLLEEYRPDPEGNVHTIFQWLIKIYNGQVPPSKNEFDLDYPAYLRDLRVNGEITEAREKVLLRDAEEKVRFELGNLFKLGNRMTFGRMSVFQPVFDAQNVLTDLSRAYLSNEKLHEAMDKIRSIDGSIFLRDRDYNNEALGISHCLVTKEVLPNIILMPNVGSKGALWQEIEGKKRDTPARFMFPIFLSEDLLKTMIGVCGDFRWEMTKTEQGVHWNDLSDPSLTSEYSDYIQYYRKNHDLSLEQKEKVKKILQKSGNNLRKTFVTDYYVYMISESNGSPLMNKVTRSILFNYCPFTEEIRNKLKMNPQYTELLNRYHTHQEQKLRPLMNIIRRVEKQGDQVPQELMEEIDHLKR